MLDLDHLSRQTLGDRALEREVLEIFVRQSADDVARLGAGLGPRERREAAHAINGAARAVGAFEVAALAERVERADGPCENEIAALATAVDKTREFIVALLADGENHSKDGRS